MKKVRRPDNREEAGRLRNRLTVRRYNGETWIDNTKVGASILEAMGNDLEYLIQVLLIEDGKVVDQTAHAAKIWWQHHGSEYETTFDVEPFLHDNISSTVYSDISRRNADWHCEQIHQQSLGPS